jgi:hypothetical protein
LIIASYEPLGKGIEPMAVTLAIFNDNGEIYCMGKDTLSVINCIQSCTSKGKKMKIKLIKDTGKQMAYIARAIDTMEGGGK